MTASLAEKQADEALAIALEFAERKISLAEMSLFCDLEAHKIEGSERARLLAGLIEEPNWEQIERVAFLLSIRRFLDQCRETPAKVADWLRGRAAGE